MVAFICDACGNTVKKNQVEKHYTNQCRSCSMLSCIDCGVDFPGDTYIKHNTCMTEAEKYQGHLYQAKEKENKGETKQKEWLKQVHSASGNMHDPKLKGLLQKLSAYSNIPRKKKKFENFCKNSVNVYDSKTLDALWDVFNAGSRTSIEATKETKLPVENGSDADSHDTEENVDASSHPHTTETDCTNMETDTIEDEITNDESFIIVTRKKKKKKHSLTNQDGNSSGESQTVDVPQVQSSGNVLDTITMSDDTVEKENKESCEIDEDNSETQSKKKKKYKEKNTVEEEVENIASELESQSIETKQNRKKKKKLNGLCENGVVINGEANNSASGNHKHETKKQKAKKRKKERLEESQLERKKKREEKHSDANGEEHLQTVESEKEDAVPLGRFSWHKAIKTILKESENHEISVKKLKKKVLDAYQEHGIDHRAPTMDESRALFDKKLKTYPKAQVAKEIVKLIK